MTLIDLRRVGIDLALSLGLPCSLVIVAHIAALSDSRGSLIDSRGCSPIRDIRVFILPDMAASANKAVRWAEDSGGSAAPSGAKARAAPQKSAMKRNQSEDDILHSATDSKKEESPSGSSDGEGSANRLRGYLEVKHNSMNGKGRSRLLRKVSGVEAVGWVGVNWCGPSTTNRVMRT